MRKIFENMPYKEYIQMENKYMKHAQNHIIMELKIKTMRYCYTSIRMAKIQSTDNTKC